MSGYWYCPDTGQHTVLIVAGNFLTIGLFAKEKKLRKKSLFLVVNMAFADLISGAVSLPLYVYSSSGPIVIGYGKHHIKR